MPDKTIMITSTDDNAGDFVYASIYNGMFRPLFLLTQFSPSEITTFSNFLFTFVKIHSPLLISTFFYFLASWNPKKKIVYLKGVKAAHLNSTRKKFHVSPRLKYSRAKKSRQMNMQPVWENLTRSIIARKCFIFSMKRTGITLYFWLENCQTLGKGTNWLRFLRFFAFTWLIKVLMKSKDLIFIKKN